MTKLTNIIIHVQLHDGKRTNEAQNHFFILIILIVFVYLKFVIFDLF